jgi:hypothetical protein
MKYLTLMILSIMFLSCSSQNRKISSDDELSERERKEQLSDFGSGYRR